MNSHKDLPAASVLYFGPYAFHLRQRLILDGDRPLRMGGRALDILQVLVEHAGRVVRKEQLIARVWPDSVVEEINLRVHIAALRRALGDGEKGQRYIVNVPQCGYSFIAPVHGDSVAQVVFDTLHAPQQNLPARLTPVIGRDSLVGRLVRQMPLCRLMTLTGPAGIGKSTVALRVAELLLQHYRDGVWYIDLSMLGDAPSLLEHLLRSLDLSFDTLASRHALLLLDNSERCRDSCRALVERLQLAAPRLALLVTSREPLQANLETLQPIAPLTFPKASTPASVEELMGYSAVQLLVSRARARQHDFSLREQDLQTVCSLCRRLDGLPLAIELAAAQIDALALVGLQAQLDNALHLLRHGRRTAKPRHQSMSAALDWSYQDLRPCERRVLQRLSVFKMAFTEEAALRVIDGGHLQSVIERLAAKSWLTVERSADVVRYRMLNLLRCYVREQPEASVEPSAIAYHRALYRRPNRSAAGVQLFMQRVEQ